MKKLILPIFAASLILFSSCHKDEQSVLTKTIISSGSSDGIIHNSSPRTLQDYYNGGQGKEITIGWDANGKAMRGFISFDISAIAPASDQILIIDKAIVKVFEANTNLNPFSGDGARTVECYLVDYGSLDINDYDSQYIDHCGTITSTGYDVLEEHDLDVTNNVGDLLTAYPATSYFQFRLQFSSDSNVIDGSTLDQAMWNIFSGDETSFSDYRPAMELLYHYGKK